MATRDESLFASTTPGLEPVLRAEAAALGWEARSEPGGVVLEGAKGLHRAANLHLRTANRILLRIAELPADADWSRALERVSLAPYQPPGAPVRLRAVGEGSAARFQALEHAARRAWRISDPGEEEDALEVQLRLSARACTVSVDTTGPLLYLRGYRQEISRAPMRETLAAGMLLLAGFTGDEPFWDPMCGSGTLPIEAALIALRRAPGGQRSFVFERWPSHDAKAWEAERAAASERARPHPAAPLWASDLHAGALGTARRNARRAGVLEHLVLERRDALAIAPPPGAAKGLLAANLPYGKRVGERRGLLPLYDGFAKAVRERFPGWRYAFLLPEGSAGALGLAPDRVHPISNGGIRCVVLTGTVR